MTLDKALEIVLSRISKFYTVSCEDDEQLNEALDVIDNFRKNALIDQDIWPRRVDV